MLIWVGVGKEVFKPQKKLRRLFKEFKTQLWAKNSVKFFENSRAGGSFIFVVFVCKVSRSSVRT